MMLNKGMQPSGAEKIMKRAWTDHPWFPFLVIIAASALAHLWCLNAVFYLDDMHIIKNNDFLRDGRMSELRGMRMWTRFFQLMQYRLFGDSSVGFHAVNWLLHTSVACVLFGFGRDFLRDRAPVGVAWFAALLFAVHPLASEIPNYARCATTGGLGVEIDAVLRVREHFIELGTPLGHAGASAEIAQFAIAAADEDRVGHDHFIRADPDAALFDDRVDGTDQVLVGAHASGDAVHDDADAVCFHFGK